MTWEAEGENLETGLYVVHTCNIQNNFAINLTRLLPQYLHSIIHKYTYLIKFKYVRTYGSQTYSSSLVLALAMWHIVASSLGVNYNYVTV